MLPTYDDVVAWRPFSRFCSFSDVYPPATNELPHKGPVTLLSLIRTLNWTKDTVSPMTVTLCFVWNILIRLQILLDPELNQVAYWRNVKLSFNRYPKYVNDDTGSRESR